ncbi:hypothetical protein COY27_00515, partial [Candidatus Woesearchaeota archaeon CG_4_10_14_0_2_um_filter_33_13]
NFLLKGEIMVVTENEGCKKITAPCSFVSGAGVKKLGYAISDTVLTTVHDNITNTTDIKEIEKNTVCDNYQEHNKFIENNNKSISKLKKVLIKNLSL